MYQDRLRSIFASVLKIPEARVRPNAHVMDELGADSLQFLDYVRTVEKELGLKIKGSESEQFSTIQRAAAFLEKRAAAAPAPVPQPAPPVAPLTSHQGGLGLDANGLLHSPLVVGMPLTGRNNLGETPLLKVIGDLRWQHVGLFSGVPSKLLTDDTGERLYATFFYVEANFSEEEPLARFGENDELRIVSSLKSYGGGVLDGYHWLLPSPLTELPADPLGSGIPYFRTSNIFVKMLQGAQWLKKSKPAQAGIDLIPQLDALPDSAELCKHADTNNNFGPPPIGWISLTDSPIVIEYDIVPDRDLNGAGLLYFANYPQILDILERKILQERLAIHFPEAVVDQRTLVKRQSAYLSNASQSDRLRVTVSVSAENPFNFDNPGERPINLWFNFVMNRISDGRKMMVSTVRKTCTGVKWADTGALEQLQEYIRPQQS